LFFAVGTVTKVGHAHIGLLVFGVFNASISLEFAKSYKPAASGSGWQHNTTGEVLEVGSDVSFVVKGFASFPFSFYFCP